MRYIAPFRGAATVKRMTHQVLLAQRFADTLALGSLLDEVREHFGSYELLEHWQQGEFHHDVVLRVGTVDRPQAVLVVATNCNGGVKEVLWFASIPQRWALWRWRCPHVQDFAGELPPLVARAVTSHYFDPCELLGTDARSELLPEFRERDEGGGWRMATPADSGERSRSCRGRD
jgi:hypothetical protein